MVRWGIGQAYSLSRSKQTNLDFFTTSTLSARYRMFIISSAAAININSQSLIFHLIGLLLWFSGCFPHKQKGNHGVPQS